ncbi:MAG TPA: hypothetical protein VFM68_02830 [Candidatus Saccharimonadales bacterium]|nr:hypothetical protein [Candidatus Saccharimonadales bacterium]
MTAEKSANFEIEKMFDLLDAYANKRTGGEWEHGRIRRVIGSSVIDVYLLNHAESLIHDYFNQDTDKVTSDDELDNELAIEDIGRCRTTEISFTAERLMPDEDDDNEISTVYTVELQEAVPIADIGDVPPMVAGQVQEKLHAAYTQHLKEYESTVYENDAAMTDEEFDSTILLNKRQIFTIAESQEAIDYRVELGYGGETFDAPTGYYDTEENETPEEDIPAELLAHNQIVNQEERDMNDLQFNDILFGSYNEKIIVGHAESARAAQVMALLSLLEYGKVTNEEETKAIRELM